MKCLSLFSGTYIIYLFPTELAQESDKSYQPKEIICIFKHQKRKFKIKQNTKKKKHTDQQPIHVSTGLPLEVQSDN